MGKIYAFLLFSLAWCFAAPAHAAPVHGGGAASGSGVAVLRRETSSRSQASKVATSDTHSAGPDHSVWVVWAPGYRTFEAKCQGLLAKLDLARRTNTRPVKLPSKNFEKPGLIKFPPQ